MNTYLIHFDGKQYEVVGKDVYSTKVAFVNEFNIPKRKQSLVSINLCKKADQVVVHSTASL